MNELQELNTNNILKLNINKNKLEKIIEKLDRQEWYAYIGSIKDRGNIYTSHYNNKIFCIKDNNNNTITGKQFALKKDINIENMEDLKEIVFDNNIINIVSKFLKKKPVIAKIDTFYTENYNTDTKPVKKQKWHYDANPFQRGRPRSKCATTKFIKIFIPLCHVTKENGATQVMKNTTMNPPKKKFKPGERIEDKFILKNYNQQDIQILESKLGEIFIVDTSGLHKGGFVRYGSRLMIIVEYN